MDPPVAEVADQQVAAERAEVGRRQGHAPRRVERAVAGQPVPEPAVVGEYVHETEATAVHFVGAVAASLLRVGHYQIWPALISAMPNGA